MVFNKELVKARCITCRLSNNLFTVGVSLLDLALRFTARLRDYLIRVLLRLVLRSLLIFSGTNHIVECWPYCLWRLRLHNVHLADKNAGVVVVHVVLQTLLNIISHAVAPCCQNLIHEVAANHVTNSRLGCVVQTPLRILHREHILNGVFDSVLHRDFDIDDVFIGSQHRVAVVCLGIELRDVDQ